MASIVWDQVGERLFEGGIDKGVLYLSDAVVGWNGLSSVDEDFNQSTTSYYQDGIKFLEVTSAQEFSATLKAFTYPDEFDEVLGVKRHTGLLLHEQMPKQFGLCYRTRVGNDVDGVDHGYKIHIIYNVSATENSVSHQTISDSTTLAEFSWALTSTPVVVAGHRPTSHITLDSTKMIPEILAYIEGLLYGTDTTDPYLPSMTELINYIDTEESIIITDNGDGTWTAVNFSGYIHMLDPTTAEIDNVDATFLDANTYSISSTTPDWE